MNYKSNLKQFNRINLTKNISKFVIILILVALLFFLILFISDYGLDGLMFQINKEIIIVMFLASFGLGCSSFIVQSISNNKLADTSILGISSINLLSLIIMVLFLNLGDQNSLNTFLFFKPIIFIFISVLASISIYLLSQKNKYQISKKFVLAGILINFCFSAIASGVSVLLPSTKKQILTGYINGKIENVNDIELYFAIGAIILSLIWMYMIIKKFKITTTNVYVAYQLGINIKSIYFQSLIISGILTGAAFLMCGNVVFLGLLGANIAYTIFKKNYKYSFISSGLISFVILGLTFFINRNLLTSTNINTAYLIPLIAAPYFLYLVIKKS